tara:strand:- start:5679 stop:9482 length:3804 start_codon:yes stop_codon:yes gene_type:complete
MAYQKSTSFSGFRKRTAQDDSKQYKDLAKNLEAENTKTLKDFQTAAAAQITEMGRVSKLEAAADTYELNNLRKFSQELDGFLDSAVKNVVKPVFDAQMQEGINQGILAQQGDPGALEKVRLNDLQELELEQRSNKIVEETEFETERIKDKYTEDLKNDLRTEYRLLNLKKQNSNFARGYRKGMLMEAATGWDAYRDSVLTDSSNYDIQGMEVEHNGERYRIGDYYKIKDQEIRDKILAAVQADYISKEGNGFSKFLVNKHLINPVIERTNLFQQKEFQKEQVELAQERLNDLKVKFENNFENLETDVGEAQAVAVIQHALNILPSTMKMAGVEGSYNQAAKAKLIEMLTDKGSFLYNGSLANQDDQNDILDFFEKPLFYVKGISKMEGNTMKLSSLSDLMAGAINREQLQSAMLAAQYDRAAKEIEGKKINLKQTLENINIQFKGDPNGKALALNQVMNENYGKYWAKNILSNNIDGYEGLEPYDEDQSVQVLLELEKKFNVGDEESQKYGIIPLSSINLERIDPAVLAAYIEDGKIGDPYAKEPGAYKKHAGYTESMTELAKVIFSRNVGNGSLTQADADLQVENFTDFISPLILSTARGYVATENITLNEGLDRAASYWKSQLKGYNGQAADGWQAGGVDLEISTDGWVNDSIYKTEAAVIASPKTIKNKENNKLTQVAEIFNNTESPNLFETKLFFDKSDISYFALDNRGDIHPIFHRMSILSEGGTPPEVIFNQQAKLLEPVTGLDLTQKWDDATQQRIDAWQELNLNEKKALVSGETESFNRTIMGVGFFSPYNLMSSMVTTDGKLPLNGEEANLILNEMGLPAMKFDDLLADPKLLETVLNGKIRKGLELTKDLTNNDNIRVRMVAAYMATGDVNNWNSDDYQMFTAKVLSSYKSGDTSAVEPFFRKFNMNSSTFKVDYNINENYMHPEDSVHNEQIANNFEGITGQLLKLDAEGIPEKFIDVAPIETGVLSGLLQRMVSKNPTRILNPAYVSYTNLKQNLEDKKVIFQQLEGKGNIAFGILSPALARTLGTDRYKEVRKEADELFRNGKFIKKDDALMYVLVQQPEFSNIAIEKYKKLSPKPFLSVEASRYNVGGDLVGNIAEEDLITIRGLVNPFSLKQGIKNVSFDNAIGGKVKIRKDAFPDWKRFFDDAVANGHRFGINDGYRTNKQQAELLEEKEKKNLGKDVKEPRKSNHNAGVSLDLNWATEADYQWLLDNYKKYNLCPHTGTPTLDMNSGNNPGEIEAWHWSWDPTGSCNLER